MSEAVDTLERFGADPGGLRLFDEDGPALLPYATLTAARAAGDADLAAMLGAYEWQYAPLMFLVDAGRLGSDSQGLARIRRMVAMRGDAPYLGVVAPGRLDVYRIALDDDSMEHAHIDLGMPDAATFPRLANARPGAPRLGRGWITQVVLDLLDQALDALRLKCELRTEDAISLAGRALFARFLGDRRLLPETLQSRATTGTLFDDASSADGTSKWLDETFNGDFLPMSPGTFEQLPAAGFAVLGDITRRAPGGQLSLGWQEGWAGLDFAHIPVGVLSQAYERYQGKHDPVGRRRKGGYYTPRPIAELMVRAAFAPLVDEGVAARARVLDPAAGGGVFLLSAFRRLVAERWRSDGTRPDTQVLRDILYGQLTGLDIDESALRFAALGLYLMSIELDPDPEPVAKLRFKDLRGQVLHRVSPPGDDIVPCLGSLDPACSDAPAGAYDLVIGNPPWATGTGLPGWPSVITAVAEIARQRSNGTSVEARLPNEGLDLPFVWRAMEWARPGAQIAFALHGRLLFQQGDGMPQARSALFGALDVTGVVNGADLRKTDVWPNVAAPFCLLFARNRVPSAESAFRFVSPRLEPSLNEAGEMRIDALSADLVTASQVTERPDILKVLFRGGDDDLRLIERIETSALISIFDYWKSRFGPESGRRLNFSGNGYQTLRASSRTRQVGDGLPGRSSAYVHDLPEVTPDALDRVLIDTDQLLPFKRERIHDPRPRNLFYGPLLIVHKSPPAGGTRIRIGVAERDVVYNQRFYGYSGKAHPDGAALCRFLGLIVGSKPALWLALITSGEFGFERDTLEKSTVDGILVPNFDELPQTDRLEADRLFDQLRVANDEPTWGEVDAWVARLYGLRPRDLQIIDDTLRYNLPFAKNREAAHKPPTRPQVEQFRAVLEAELQPWGRRNGLTIAVHPSPTVGASPWRGLQVRTGAERAGRPEALDADWPSLLLAADQIAATLMIYHDKAAGWIGIELLDQARYWSETRARALARKLAWDHIDFLIGRATGA
jgi:hypothetical protein